MDTSRIQAIFERYTSGYHFFLRDLRSGEAVELGTRRAWPIGSCFKLAVLVAYFEAVADGSLSPDNLDQETLIPPEKFRIGGGVINLLDSAIRLTDRHMLHLMIATSDGTSTDMLVGKIGLARVDATLRRFAPDSHLACNLGDMVAAFRTIPESVDCKTRRWGAGEADKFIDNVASLGATNAVDLANLALGAFEHEEQGCRVSMQRPRSPQRTEMFIQPALNVSTKSGSLGLRYFTQDCGVISLQGDNQPLATFGYCSCGMRLPAMVSDVAMGMVGVEIAKALGLTEIVNSDWTPEGAALLLGDLP